MSAQQPLSAAQQQALDLTQLKAIFARQQELEVTIAKQHELAESLENRNDDSTNYKNAIEKLDDLYQVKKNLAEDVWYFNAMKEARQINDTRRLRTKLQKVQTKMLTLTKELKPICQEHQRLTMTMISHNHFNKLNASTDLNANHDKVSNYIRNVVLLEQRVDNLLRVVLDEKNPNEVIKHGSDITEVFSLISNAEQNDWNTIRTSIAENNKRYAAIVKQYPPDTDEIELKQSRDRVAGSGSKPALRFSRPQGNKPTQGKGNSGAGHAMDKPAHGKEGNQGADRAQRSQGAVNISVVVTGNRST